MKQIKQYLEAHAEESVRQLCDYASIPSVSAQPAHSQDMDKCSRWLQQHCNSIGLETRLYSTPGYPVLIAKTPRAGSSRKPHFLVYGHYDVQPPEPFELWKSPPFEPRIEGKNLYARGASDNKGQHFAHLKAVEAYMKTGTELPCDLTFLIEGEEETGSGHLPKFLRQNRNLLKCDAVVISDNGIPSLKHPTLTYALRGIAALEIRLDGPSRDLHSGIYGGSLENPAMALCQMLAQLRDKNGRITIPGFYDDVIPLSRYEREQFKRLPHDEEKYRKFLGVPELFGEKGYTSTERRTARPTLEINGLTSGYQGDGSKTIVPAWATAKLTFRLVADQDPKRILKLVCEHLQKICLPTVRLKMEKGHSGAPYMVSPQSTYAQAAMRALETAFHQKPLMAREGGSIPIVTEIKKILGADTLLLGLGLPDDNVHSPNEKFSLEAFEKGKWMSANLWRKLSAV